MADDPSRRGPGDDPRAAPRARTGSLSRRRLRAAAAAAGGLGGLAAACRRLEVGSGPEPARPATLVFPQPPELRSAGGVLEATLRVAETEVELPGTDGPRRVLTRCYNGSVPGPTLRVKPGDRLDLRLVNDLAPAPPPCDGEWRSENRPHGFDVTNLHTHGLHVSPGSVYAGGGAEPERPGERPALASDDILLRVEPGSSQPYRIWLPDFHAPGSHWYHAHKHGAAAFQMAGGMAGALIVEEPPGAEIAPGAKDLVWVVHELLGDDAAKLYTRNPPPQRFYVNGADQPTLDLRPGEVQRWRVINATGTLAGYGAFKLLDAAGQAQPMHLVAVDGITFYGHSPQPKTEWVIPPGGRADFLIQLRRAGRYRVVKDTVAQAPATFRQDLAFVEVAGAALETSLPARLPGGRPRYLEPIRQAEQRPENVRFGIERRDEGTGPCGLDLNEFQINEKTYRRDVIDQRVSLNAVEQWELTNRSAMLHPFHIHVNPFQVIDGPDHLIDAQGPDAPDNWIWRDVVGVPAGTPERLGRVRIRSRFLTYAGRYVLHCHFLVHEDLGMMQNVLVSGEGAPPCRPVESC